MKLVVEFKPARCPNCSGEIQIPTNMEKVKCTYCGSEILVQEAVQKYVVEVSGKVKLDRENEIENFKKLGARAIEDRNFKDSFNYYSKILEMDPEDTDAIFYRGLSRAWLSTLLNNSLYDANNGAVRAIEIMQKKGCSKEELYPKINTFSVAIYNVIIAVINMVERHYKEPKYETKSVEDYFGQLLKCTGSLEGVTNLYSDAMLQDNELYKKNKITYLKKLVDLYIHICKGKKCYEYSTLARGKSNKTIYINENTRAKIVNKYELAVKEIQKYENNYNPEKIRSKGGCYIATAVYGDYDAPEVIVLRKFRDNVLKKHLLGRIFIQIYYTVSPPIARRLRNKNIINRSVKKLLDGIVNKLS